jgi:hypothetical protein
LNNLLTEKFNQKLEKVPVHLTSTGYELSNIFLEIYDEVFEVIPKEYNLNKKVKDDELKVRLMFEIVCFTGFYLSIIGNSLAQKSNELKSYSKAEIMDSYMCSVLLKTIQTCDKIGVHKYLEQILTVREIEEKSTPEINIIDGKPLDAIERFDTYRACYTKEPGSDGIKFCNYIGSVFDPKNYMLFDTIPSEFIKSIFKVNVEFLREIFL